MRNEGSQKNNDGMKLDGDPLDLFSNTRKTLHLQQCRRRNGQRGVKKKQKTHKSKVDAPRSARGRPKCIIFNHIHEALEIYIKNTPFPPLATDAKARRTRKDAYLCTVSEGDRSPPVPAAVKKEAPSATHGSLVVIEHGRTHKTTIRYPLFALENRTPSH